MMKNLKWSLMTVLFFYAAIGNISAQKTFTIQSPDGKITAEIVVGSDIKYRLTHDQTKILDFSPISLSLNDGTEIGENAKVVKSYTSTVNELITSPFYKKSDVLQHYNELSLSLNNHFQIIFRAYNEGFAYRFVNNRKEETTVVSETANFVFPENFKSYAAYCNSRNTESFEDQLKCSYENTYNYNNLTLLNNKRLIFLPILVEANDNKKVCITEVDLENYPGMLLNNDPENPTLNAYFAHYPKTITQGGHNKLQGIVTERENYIAKNIGKNLPWRVIIISQNDEDLANSDMVYRLAAPSRVEDISWIIPGKVAWDWWNDWNIYGVDFQSGINNETYQYYIDFASKYGIEYVILDEGWAVNNQADLMQVIPEIDLQSLVEYGKSKNVGIVLWAGYWAFNRDMEQTVKHYSEIGIKGFKIDFMDRDDQMISQFLYQAAETCARYKMFVDFHGIHKPTGLQKTYPNVLNYEGVFGLEQMKWADKATDIVTYDVTIPFIRMVAGPMDYTQGAMRNAIKNNYRPIYSEAMSQGTRCHQLAEYVVFESPFNMLCDAPSNYLAEPECTEFIANIPTVWDETKVLSGKVSEYIVIARRKGNCWYIGGLTNWTSREIELDLSFINTQNITAELFKDGINANRSARDFKKDKITVSANKRFPIKMMSGGGFVLKIEL